LNKLAASAAWSDAGAPPLLAKYDALVRKVARSMRPRQSSGHCLDIDDLLAEGRVAVLEAIATYDGISVAESAWVRTRVFQRMTDAIRRLDVRSRSEIRASASDAKLGVPVLIRLVISTKDEEDFMPRDGGQEEEASRREIAELAFAVINTLRGKERAVADAVIVRGESMADVALALGVTAARVSQIYKVVCEAIRDRIDDDAD